MKALACVSVCSISIAGNTYKICQDTEVLITMKLQYFDADVSKSGPLEKKKPDKATTVPCREVCVILT